MDLSNLNHSYTDCDLAHPLCYIQLLSTTRQRYVTISFFVTMLVITLPRATKTGHLGIIVGA